jgi:23S rRNA (cytidine1920-2'-O)/16S rRNA (cytidine1409-2'-O)-methyltransferase
MVRVRADLLMVQRGLAETRERAQRLIMAGQARVGTLRLVKAATMLDESAEIVVDQPERFVSRGGLKLQAALDAFAIDLTGRACLDVGASTGGFTDCMLQAGAATVLAVDVGRAQLHQKLREDGRVTLREGINARNLPELPAAISFFAADLSFISLRKVLPSLAARLSPGTEGVVLLKPQFEAGPADVPRGGVIRDPAVRERVLREFLAFAEDEGWTVEGALECPVHGGDGNIEHLLHVRSPGVAAC